MQLSLSLFLTAVGTALSAAIPVQSTELNPDNFRSAIATGLWLIEYYSPYCRHCQAFAPTWEKFVQASTVSTPNVNFAQVNCIAYDDLCHENGVTGYPQLTMHQDGQVLENFSGVRDLPSLEAFTKRHADAHRAPPPNKDGQVLQLTEAIFQSTLSKSPMFVKFFAPWCGHCKKLAPVWTKLASQMQNKLVVAEVNCDIHGTLCRTHDVQGYPTLIYLTPDGLRSEYGGGRKLEQLTAFAQRAISTGVTPFKTDDLQKLVQDHEVLYVLLHAGSKDTILETVKKASVPLLGSPPIHSSSDPSLFSRFSIPQTSTWALVALKDHDAEVPSSIHHERDSSDEKLTSWLLTHRLPTTIELTQDTFQAVMNAPQNPLVLIAPVTAETLPKVRERLRELGKMWKARTQGTGLFNGREVVFTWMNVERWRDWMKSMYGIQNVAGLDAGMSAVPVVIADHKWLVYWDKDSFGKHINLANATNVFEATEAAAAGTLAYVHSENYAERLARFLNRKIVSIEGYVSAYPGRTIFLLVIFILLGLYGLKRFFADEPHEEYRKAERLD